VKDNPIDSNSMKRLEHPQLFVDTHRLLQWIVEIDGGGGVVFVIISHENEILYNEYVITTVLYDDINKF
jgi:hypothetical protein